MVRREGTTRTIRRTPLAPAAAIVAISLAIAVPAAAQNQNNDAAEARLRFGPLGLTPAVTVRDLGVDTNVFNEAVDPKRDFTSTVSPETQFWLSAGPLQFSGRAAVGLNYFRRYTNQRGVNVGTQVRMNVPINRVTPYLTASLVNTRARPGLDIDLRARRIADTVGGGVDVRLSPRTSFDVNASASRNSFEAGAVVDGNSLREGLNRRSRSYSAAFRYAVTSLTTIVVIADRDEDRFVYSTGRNADTYRIMPGVEFKAFALITGHAQLGYRSFKPFDPALEPFVGTVASIDLGYLAPSSTRFTVKADRDVSFSFNPQQPFYVSTGLEGTVTQYIGDTWDVSAGLGSQALDYRQRDPSITPMRRTGLITNLGVGIVVGPALRLGFDARHAQRRSRGVPRGDFEGWHAGTFIRYGF